MPNRSPTSRAQSVRAARNFAISSRKSLWTLKKNDSRGAIAAGVEARASRGREVLEPVREREGDLLHGRRARLADVVARDRDRVPARDVLLAEREDVGDEAQRRLRRERVRPPRRVFLEDVVLDRPRERRPRRCRGPSRRRGGSARRIDAVALIVIEIETLSSGIPSRSVSMSSRDAIGNADLARPRRARARGPSRSRSGSGGRTPRRGRSAPGRGETGTGGSTPSRSRSPRTAASSRASSGSRPGRAPRVNGAAPGQDGAQPDGTSAGP